MNRRLFARLAAWPLALALLVAGMAGAAPAAIAESAEQVEEIRGLLERYHLSRPDGEELNRAAIEGMIYALGDPYTEYLPPEEWEAYQRDLEQEIVGIGVYMTNHNQSVYITDVIPDSPAERAGIQPGDVIVEVDGTSVKTTDEARNLLLGKAGTTANVVLIRDGRKISVRVTRQLIRLASVSGQPMGDGVGYLALTGFTSDSPERFAERLEQLEKGGLKALIVDIRNNGGGYIEAAQKIASHFIRNGVLAHMINRDDVDTPLSVSGTPRPYPVVLLVNEATASAAELLAGALQDYGAARLVGRNTYGKGVTQLLVPLSFGGVLKVTTQEYLTPNNRKVEGVGLAPDIVVQGPAAQLAAAFRAAGGKTLQITYVLGNVTINGVRMRQPNAVYNQNGVWYVNGHFAAAMLGAELGYDADARTVNMTRDGKTLSLRIDDHRLHIQNGLSAFDIRTLAEWAPELRWNVDGDTVKLTLTAATG
jgi:carboxyl-terminal processing protease